MRVLIIIPFMTSAMAKSDPALSMLYIYIYVGVFRTQAPIIVHTVCNNSLVIAPCNVTTQRTTLECMVLNSFLLKLTWFTIYVLDMSWFKE